MNKITLLIIALFCWACASTPIPRNSTKKLGGKWNPVKQELGGNTIAKKIFNKEILSIKDTSYVISVEGDVEGVHQDEGSIFIDKNKIDFYGKVGKNKGKHFTAIFKIEKNQLIICYNLGGIGFPESFETKGKPLYFKSVYQFVE